MSVKEQIAGLAVLVFIGGGCVGAVKGYQHYTKPAIHVQAPVVAPAPLVKATPKVAPTTTTTTKSVKVVKPVKLKKKARASAATCAQVRKGRGFGMSDESMANIAVSRGAKDKQTALDFIKNCK